jgi:hypothetical protein
MEKINTMPSKLDKEKIGDPFLDRRIKLLPCQKEMVFWWYERGLSINKIAKLFNVNKRLIQFTLFPERKKKNLEHRADRGGYAAYYKGGPEWAKTVKEHRDYKKHLNQNYNLWKEQQ